MTPSALAAQVEADRAAVWAEWARLPGTDLEVTAQPLRLAGPGGVIAVADAASTQRIADALEAYPVTAQILDLIWRSAAVVCLPRPRRNLGTWAQAEDYSHELDQWLIGIDRGLLTASGGKIFSLEDTAPDTTGNVWNYGSLVPLLACHSGTWGGMETRATALPLEDARAVQWLQCGHNPRHWDYSQQIVLCRPVPGADLVAALSVGRPRPLSRVRLLP
jgi:hypothetical protein